MIKTRPTPARTTGLARQPGPGFGRLLPLALTLLAAVYMLLIGGTFDAGLRYRVQLLNTILAGSIALAWLAARQLRRERVTMTGLEWPLALFALTQWLALPTSAQPRLSLEWVASVTAWSASLLILCDLLRTGWSRQHVLNALLLLAGLVTLEGLVEIAAWYAGWLGARQWPPIAFRLNGVLGHANLTACFLNLLLPLALVRAAAPQRPLGRAALLALAAGMLVVLFFTSSRAGWLAAAVGLSSLATLAALRIDQRAAVHIIRLRWRGLSTGARWLAALAALAVLVLAAWLLAAQSQHITHGPLFSSRQTFWMVAWNMFQSQPLTGAGPDLFTWFYTRWVASPPLWFAPHAHSLLLQVLGGSGLMGAGALLVLAASAGLQLWQRWRQTTGRLLLAGLMAGLIAVAFQHLFDYLLGSGVMVFSVVVLLALALTTEAPATPRRAYPALALAPALLVPLAVASFALRGAALNDEGLTRAAENDWPAAARAFEAAALADPGLTLYWQHAAYAYARAEDLAAARPLWQRAARDDPYWPLLPATVGVLGDDLEALRTAATLNGGQHPLLELNEGVLAEAAGDLSAARLAFERALSLRPASAAALFWQQTEPRRSVLAAWLSQRGTDTAPLSLGEQALAAGQPDQARVHFQAALDQNPAEIAAYVGLAQAYLELGDAARAEHYRQAAQRLPILSIESTLTLRTLTGDSARARGDLPAAASAYGEAFSIINDYTLFGPGTYGYPQRSWYVYRRHSLPSDLVPQFARADITAPMDQRFAWLAEWNAAQGHPDIACLIAARVWREAPASESGDYWSANCH